MLRDLLTGDDKGVPEARTMGHEDWQTIVTDIETTGVSMTKRRHSVSWTPLRHARFIVV